MTPVTPAATNRIYACNDACSHTVHYACHPRFRTFSMALAQIDRALGETAGDDFWRDWLRQLRRYRFDVSAAPYHSIILPPSSKRNCRHYKRVLSSATPYS
jgi:hypothetical protein